MSTPTEQLLRRLLPRYLWLRDAEDGGGALAALVDGVADQYEVLHDRVALLYDQFFIATCDPEYVPLIGEDIGITGLASVSGPGVGDRAWVGRVLGLRRRKGSLAATVRGVIAASGWAAYAVEGRTITTATASVADPDQLPPALVTLTGPEAAAELDQPWSAAGRIASISGRPIMAGQTGPSADEPAGFPAPATVAIHVWRLGSFPVTERAAAPASDAPEHLTGRAFRFDPLGRDVRLFCIPVPPTDPELAPDPSELPLPLTVELLARALRAAGTAPVQVAGAATLAAGALAGWRHPAGAPHADAIVDPLRGRLLLAEPTTREVVVSYAYGFAGELGGGPYGTTDDYASLPQGTVTIPVAQAGPAPVTSLHDALRQARHQYSGVVLEDSGTYRPNRGRWELSVPKGGFLRISSAPEAAPVLAGDVVARIGAQGRLELSGLTIAGAVRVDGDGELAIEHCTLAPEPGRTSLTASPQTAVAMSFSVSGAISAGDAGIASSIVHGDIGCSGSLDLQQTTVLGDASADTLNAGDCIVTAAADAARGLVRTSYLGAAGADLQRIGCTGPHAGGVRFSSTRWGDPDYCQLSLTGPASVASGGSVGSEMGAFNWLGQPQRLARVPVVLRELLPAGIGASLNYVN
jgi:hypothetical protein